MKNVGRIRTGPRVRVHRYGVRFPPSSLRWVRQPPTADGWYWFRERVGSIFTKRPIHVMTMANGELEAYVWGIWEPVASIMRRFRSSHQLRFSNRPIESPNESR